MSGMHSTLLPISGRSPGHARDGLELLPGKHGVVALRAIERPLPRVREPSLPMRVKRPQSQCRPGHEKAEAPVSTESTTETEAQPTDEQNLQ